MRVELTRSHRLWFGPSDPVRAASAVGRLGDGWLIAQDDANHAAWWRPATDAVQRVRLFPPDGGLDVFGEADGTKHRKPDLEAACEVPTGGHDAVLLLGSGGLPPRTRGVLVRATDGDPVVRWAPLAPLYERVRAALGVDPTQLNLEGACVVGDRLRWFQRGHGPTGVASASVDLDLAALLAAIAGDADPAGVELGDVRRYALGSVDGVPYAITDAVAWRDAAIVVSVTAEDAPDAIADGPVRGSALALLDGDHVEVLPLPPDAARAKVEGLALLDATDTRARLLAVVDDDDPTVASLAFELTLHRALE